MPATRPSAFTAFLLALALSPAAAQQPAARFTPSRDERALLELTNKERQGAGLPPLRLSEKLFRAARTHSANMARQAQLGHTLDGKAPGDRLRDAGYRWSVCGENCAQGQRSPGEAVRCWMASPGHRAALLNGCYTETGFGVAQGADGQLYYTQVFAAPTRP
ncbi:MAG: CAP domain-containing protein [Gemmataceae bacterium]